jgi:hypothetical protein
MATLKLLKAIGMSEPTSITTFTISGEGTESLPYFGNSTNQGLHGTTANATFSIVGAGTATLEYNVDISSETNFDFGRIRKNGNIELQVSGTGNHTGSFSVSNGDSVQVQYFKDGSVNTGSDTFTVNSLFITGSPTVRFLGGSTLRFVDLSQTTMPTFNSASATCTGFFPNTCSVTWRMRNADDTTATINSEANSTSTNFHTDFSVPPNELGSSVTQTGVEAFNDGFSEFIVIYARATATGKSTSNLASTTIIV